MGRIFFGELGFRLEGSEKPESFSKILEVCILNMTKGCEMPPPGYKAPGGAEVEVEVLFSGSFPESPTNPLIK